MYFEVTVEIDACQSQAWTVLTDVARYPEWTDSMTRVRRVDAGQLRVGSTAKIKQPRLPTAVWEVTELQPGHAFTWQAKSPGITTVAGHRLDSREKGRTTLAMTIHQSGPLAPVFRPLTARLVRRYATLEAHGLKRRCQQCRS